MSKTVINSDKAPAAIGTYSQAIKAGNTVYMSGQIPLDPKTMELVEGFEAQTVRCSRTSRLWPKPQAVRSRTSSS